MEQYAPVDRSAQDDIAATKHMKIDGLSICIAPVDDSVPAINIVIMIMIVHRGIRVKK